MMREHGDKLDMDVLNSMDTLHLNIQVRRRRLAAVVAAESAVIAMWAQQRS